MQKRREKQMAKNDNAQAIKLYDSIKENIGDAAAGEVAKLFPLTKSADFNRKFKWAENICTYLESNFSPEQIAKIRFRCSCTLPEKYLEKVKKIYVESTNLDEFTDKYNNEYAGKHQVWHNGSDLYFSYPVCYCSSVKRVNKTLPKTWCLCTVGYTKKLFDYVLDSDTNVELRESIKLGNSRCVIKVTGKFY